MNLLDFFDDATQRTALAIAAVRPDQLHSPTPCSQWDVGQLLEHIFAVNGQARAMAAGVDVAADGSTPDPMGEDLRAAYAASTRSLRQAFAEPDILERVLATPMGPFDGRVVFTVTSLEHLIHGWDLATALALPWEFDPVGVGYAFRAIEGMDEVFANFRNWGAYAPALTPQPGADPATRLLATLGRSPSEPGATDH